MSGVGATRAIRRDEARTGRRRTPIVTLSGDVLDHHQAEHRTAGMDAGLAKPVALRQFHADRGGRRRDPAGAATGRLIGVQGPEVARTSFLAVISAARVDVHRG